MPKKHTHTHKMQEQTRNVSREMKTLSYKGNIRRQKYYNINKNGFNGIISNSTYLKK